MVFDVERSAHPYDAGIVAASRCSAEAPDNMAFDWGMGDEEATQRQFDRGGKKRSSLNVGDNPYHRQRGEPRGFMLNGTDGKVQCFQQRQGVWVQ